MWRLQIVENQLNVLHPTKMALGNLLRLDP